MHRPGKLLLKRPVDQSMTLYPGETRERFRHDLDTKMAFSRARRTRMTGVTVRIIHNLKLFRCKSLC